MYQEHSLQ